MIARRASMCLVLRHQLHVLERQVARPRLEPEDRIVLAARGELGWSEFLRRRASGIIFIRLEHGAYVSAASAPTRTAPGSPSRRATS